MVLAVMLTAAIVPVDKAKTAAQNFYNHRASSSDNAITEVLTKEYNGVPAWYAFNFKKGFVIVSASDELKPILGYSLEEGTYIDSNLEDMNSPFNYRFNALAQGIVERDQVLMASNANALWEQALKGDYPAVNKTVVGPLIETHWHQSSPFNDLCPSPAPVGCVATAMAQILRYHQGPETGASSHSYTDNAGDIQGSHSVDFYLQTYDWSLMQDLYAYQYDATESAEVAELCYALGVSVDMDYNSDGSGAYTSDARDAYVNYFSFDNGAAWSYLGTVTDASAQLTLRTDLDAGLPVQYGGDDGVEGHSFVLDGYDDSDDTYHFNLGWGGSGDGWFTLTALSYNQGVDIVYGLQVDGNLALMPAPTNLSASASAIGDVTLTWTAGSANPMGDLIDYEIYKNGSFVRYLGSTATTFVDYAASVGTHTYSIRGVYENPDGHSNPSNEDVVTITEDPDYPAPLALGATSYHLNRQKIDLVWSKPFVGSQVFADGFESNVAQGDIPVGWNNYQATSATPSSWTEITAAGGFETNWFAIDGNANPTWVNNGRWAAAIQYMAPDFNFLVTEGAYDLTGATLTWWPSLFGDESWYTVYHLAIIAGDLSSPSGNVTVVQTWDTQVDPVNDYEHVEEVDLSSYGGATNYHLAFIYEWTDGYSFKIDDVVLGSDPYPAGDQPLSYNIYNNDRLIDNVSLTGLQENYEVNSPDFDDGWNDFSIRAVYAGSNYSIGSSEASAWIDANPVPLGLEGEWVETKAGTVDLTWYQPGSYPPHWFGYEYDNDDWYFVDFAGVSSWRTTYTAVDFDMTYPMVLEAFALCFVDSTYIVTEGASAEWAGTSDQFTLKIGTNSGGDLYTSGLLTADPSGEYVNIVLPESLVVGEDWYVEVALEDSVNGYPYMGCFIHDLGIYPNSDFWYYSQEGWYIIYFTDETETEKYYIDWDIFCYGYNQEPVIAKQPKASPDVLSYATPIESSYPVEAKKGTVQYKKDNLKNVVLENPNTKGIASYNVYKNGSYEANTTNKYWTDTAPGASNTYYVTAVYTDPVGESVASNEVTVDAPPAIGVPASITEALAPEATGNGSFNIGNTGYADLDYTIDLVLDGYASQQTGVTFHSEDFSSSGNYTVNYGGVWSDNLGYLYLEGSKAPVEGTATSPAFSTVGAVNMYLDFSSDFSYRTSSWVKVEYFNGTDWVEVYSATASASGTQHVALSTPSGNTQLRFSHYLTRQGSNATWTIDDITVTGDQYVPYTWMDITSSLTGTVTPSGSNTINYDLDATGLAVGPYTGTITITSNDPGSPNTIPVTLNVGGSAPDPVTNIQSVVNGTNLDITWDVSANATGYMVYSSADPYGTFDYVETVATEAYSPAIADKMFYYFVATNSKTAATAPKKIYIAKPASAK